MNVSACLVTRGDVSMKRILREIEAAGITDVCIWNNALEIDLAVYGRYAAIEQARHDLIYVQDDDCVVPSETIRALVAEHKPGQITANMPARFRQHYPDSCLVGFGAVFDRDLPEQAFRRFSQRWEPGDKVIRPDVVFTALSPRTTLDLPVEILPCAYEPHRMYLQRGHALERNRVLNQARKVRDRLRVQA